MHPANMSFFLKDLATGEVAPVYDMGRAGQTLRLEA